MKKSNLFLNPKIIGFYFQQILHEKTNYDIKKDNESLKEEFLKSWKIIPSPLISVEECKKLLKTDPRYEAVCSLMNIEENKYFGTYKTR